MEPQEIISTPSTDIELQLTEIDALLVALKNIQPIKTNDTDAFEKRTLEANRLYIDIQEKAKNIVSGTVRYVVLKRAQEIMDSVMKNKSPDEKFLIAQ